jgi:SAM-dependent methyltransferase
MIFADYAAYYDLLNQDKDYEREADYIYGLLRNHDPSCVNILDLGCGTGRHDRLLASKGCRVTGVDMAEKMLSTARSSSRQPADCEPEYLLGDIRSIRLERKFDAVISVFHVMSYQVSNDDIQRVFATAYHHLDDGGIFVFDFWYGPAVLTDRPTPRIKRIANDEMEIIRFAEPRMQPQLDVVEVQYRILINDLKHPNLHQIEETHRMRYLFQPEIEMFAAGAGFQEISFRGWLKDSEPTFTTWGACCITRKSNGQRAVPCVE